MTSKILVYGVSIATSRAFDMSDLRLYFGVLKACDDELAELGHPATAEIEQFAAIAFLRQHIRVMILEWLPKEADEVAVIPLPIGPIIEPGETIITVDGQPLGDFNVLEGPRPMVLAGCTEDLIGKRISIHYSAGFGDDASSVPSMGSVGLARRCVRSFG